jgi:formate hydrogenlyase transcriptional activator
MDRQKNTTIAALECKIRRRSAQATMPHSEPTSGTRTEAELDRTLLEINNALISSLTQDSLLSAIGKALHRVVQFDAVALILYMPERDTFRILALEGIVRNFHVGQEIGRANTSVGWVFEHKQYILRHDLETEAEYENERRLLEEGMHSNCVVPLIARGTSIGTLNLASKNLHQYSHENASFLQAVATQIALAVQNMNAYQEIASLNAQVSRTAEKTRTLLEINNTIVTKLTKDELLHAICEATKRAVPFDEVGLMLHEPDTDTLRVVAIEGPLPSEFFKLGHPLNRDGPAGRAFDRRRVVLRKDLEREAQTETERRVLADGILSVCGLPLIVHDRCLGALSFASLTRNQYSDEDASFLQEVANQVAIAIANMKSHEEIASLNTKITRAAERSRTLLEINNAIITSLSQDALLQSISKVLRGFISFDRFAVPLYQPERETFRFLSIEGELKSDYFYVGLEIDRKEVVSDWVYRERRAAIRRDLEKEQQYSTDRRLIAEGIKSYCVVPMVAHGKCIGTLAIGSKAKNQYYEKDAEFLQEVATQVALAVENMQAFEEINALKTRIEAENVYLQQEIFREHNFEEIIGNSPPLLQLLRNIEMIAPTDASVLLYGETGTGKELLARAIHSRSPRRARAMVTVNCGAIPSGLVESELFGHVKGSFTGALHDATGRFELADGSTLFLDEVGELPSETQVKLLRVLQEHEFQPVGSSRTKKVDVRIIAATNRNLQEDVRAGRFRSDLFYRLSVLPLKVPPLRERRVDIPELVLFFLDRSCQRLGRKDMSVSQETMNYLVGYDWPGNIRELQNVIERGVVLSRGSVLTMGHDLLPVSEVRARATEPALESTMGDIRETSNLPDEATTQRSLETIQREHIVRVLDSTGGIIDGPKGAAQILDLHPSTLRARMKKLRIQRGRQ